MPVNLGQDLSPESLIGHPGTGLVVLDDHGAVTSFNVAASRLLELDAGSALGRPIQDVIDAPEFGSWLVDPRAGRLSLTLPTRPIDLHLVSSQEGFSVLAVTDATRRIALAEKSADYEAAASLSLADWNAKAQAVALLRLLRECAEDPPSLEGVLELARRTGNVLFPTGGALCVQQSPDLFVCRESWGGQVTQGQFAKRDCAAASGDGSCLHHAGDLPLRCFPLEHGVLCLAVTDGEDNQSACLFAETVNLALANLHG